eukprot:5369250-Pyramimonas_sp.AAC.1
MKLASAVLPLFETEVRWARPLRILSGRSRRTTSWHKWEHGPLGTQCMLCFRVLNRPENEAPMDGCPGLPHFLETLRQDPAGHALVAMAGALARQAGGGSE